MGITIYDPIAKEEQKQETPYAAPVAFDPDEEMLDQVEMCGILLQG